MSVELQGLEVGDLISFFYDLVNLYCLWMLFKVPFFMYLKTKNLPFFVIPIASIYFLTFPSAFLVGHKCGMVYSHRS